MTESFVVVQGEVRSELPGTRRRRSQEQGGKIAAAAIMIIRDMSNEPHPIRGDQVR